MLHHAALFYAYNGLVVYTRPDCLKGAFDNLTGLFSRVEFRNTVEKKVGILCHPFRAV